MDTHTEMCWSSCLVTSFVYINISKVHICVYLVTRPRGCAGTRTTPRRVILCPAHKKNKFMSRALSHIFFLHLIVWYIYLWTQNVKDIFFMTLLVCSAYTHLHSKCSRKDIYFMLFFFVVVRVLFLRRWSVDGIKGRTIYFERYFTYTYMYIRML